MGTRIPSSSPAIGKIAKDIPQHRGRHLDIVKQ